MKIGRGYIIPQIIIDECAFLNVVKVLYKVRKGGKYKTLRRNKYIRKTRYEFWGHRKV